MLDALELTLVDADVFSTLQRWIYRADKHFGGERGTIILSLRCIAESEANGPKALLEPAALLQARRDQQLSDDRAAKQALRHFRHTCSA
jgi:hypothetical protein